MISLMAPLSYIKRDERHLLVRLILIVIVKKVKINKGLDLLRRLLLPLLLMILLRFGQGCRSGRCRILLLLLRLLKWLLVLGLQLGVGSKLPAPSMARVVRAHHDDGTSVLIPGPGGRAGLALTMLGVGGIRVSPGGIQRFHHRRPAQ